MTHNRTSGATAMNPNRVETLLDLAARLMNEGWPAINAFAEAKARLEIIAKIQSSAQKSLASDVKPHHT